MPLIESFTGFQPLEEVWIGGTYPENFYNHLPNQVADTFGKITEQTQTGFKNLEKTLTGLGVIVKKPKFNSIDNYMDTFDNLIKPPVAPRDWVITVGNELWILPQGYKEEPYAETILEYKNQKQIVEILDRSTDPRCWLVFPGIVRLGNKIIVDVGNLVPTQSLDKVKQAVHNLQTKYDIVLTTEGDHLDGIFCPIKQGVIFSSHWGEKTFYNQTLPGWEVFWIQPDKKSNYLQGNWWTAENNFYSPIFSKHIEDKASDWVNNSQETAFEVNMLVVDEHNVICIAEHEQSFKKMEELGITPHVVDFPTRHFWDGGIHCITVDIRRSGGKQNYFL